MERLNTEVLGDPTNPTLVLVHGFLSSNAQWLPNIDALVEQYQLILVELWGHGSSPLPGSEAFTLDRYVSEFEAIRNRLDINRWSLIGQSYAAGLTINYAIRHPERVNALMVTNSRSAFGDITAARQEKSARSNRPKGQAAMDKANNRHMPIHPIYAKRLPDAIKAKLVQAADDMTEAAITRGGLLAAKLNAESLLHQLNVPFLIANGVFEKGFQPDVERLKSMYPDLSVTDLPGGHAVNIEAAEAFNDAVLTFMAAHN